SAVDDVISHDMNGCCSVINLIYRWLQLRRNGSDWHDTDVPCWMLLLTEVYKSSSAPAKYFNLYWEDLIESEMRRASICSIMIVFLAISMVADADTQFIPCCQEGISLECCPTTTTVVNGAQVVTTQDNNYPPNMVFFQAQQHP
nr:hypothetical protein [Tanacetum cinerariifolium]